MPEIGTVFLWAGFALWRMEGINLNDGSIIVRRIGEVNPSKVDNSKCTTDLPRSHPMLDPKQTDVYACSRHGMMYF